MKKVEVLSPVGELNNFFVAIRSGADAVYLGLPKFNARMKADNITLETLPSIIRYAHLRQVKVYITLNTIVTDKESDEIIQMVRICENEKVDAYIVQDLGLISRLKREFPEIVLHGSTQLGVHNVHGARIAKSLGLSRVVLSRETTFADIREIHNNVDIELEAFVQGANCVCFSGNCYMSSIKCNASGNRGECKQLCRLPYTLSDGKKSINGYAISPRDNCMLKYIDSLIDCGVCSLKIEGRLKTSTYVAVATNVYRTIVDKLPANDIDKLESQLYRVFARGKYINGYNNGNDIIDTKFNNHIGINIGKVISCAKFKDMYKLTLNLSTLIHTGDGLKFDVGEYISAGVGNIEYIDNKYVIYVKNYIAPNTDVYLSNDTSIEKTIPDLSRKIHLSMELIAEVGRPLRLIISSGDIVISHETCECEQAQNRPTNSDVIATQLGKVDKDLYVIDSINSTNDNSYIPLSELNRIRREGIELFENVLLLRYTRPTSQLDSIIINRQKNFNDCSFDRIAIVDENCDVSNLTDFGCLILSPNVYSINVISQFLSFYKKYFDSKLVINLPIVARLDDIAIIDKIVAQFKSDVIFIANNIYALDYINSGAEVWAGSGLNIINNEARELCENLGVKQTIMSIEKWCNRLNGAYKIVGKPTLMTMTACPVKTLNNCDCANCKYSNNMTLSNSNMKFKIRRIKISNCYFELVDTMSLGKESSNTIIDLRK